MQSAAVAAVAAVAKRRGKLSTPASQSRAGVEGSQQMGQAELPELSFVHPIPGFTELRRFALVSLGAGAQETVEAPATITGVGESPLYELRSLEEPEVRFMMAVPGAYFSDYEIELDDQECADLGLIDSADALVLVMLTVGRDAASTTANLLAPVVINARTRAAAQIILTGSDWSVRAPIG